MCSFGGMGGALAKILGIFDDVATALDFDEKGIQKVISDLDALKKEFPSVMARHLSFFPGVDRTVGGYEGLITVQESVPNNGTRDKFAAEYTILSGLWEAISLPFMSGVIRERLQLAYTSLCLRKVDERQR